MRCELACLDCGRPCEWAPVLRCRDCRGALDTPLAEGMPRFDLPDPVMRYADFLPVTSESFLLQGICRSTPCRKAESLHEASGLSNLWLKDETAQFTGTTKDRMAAVVLSSFREFGISEFVAASTGNSSTSIARGVLLYPDFRVHLFTGREWLSRHSYCDQDGVIMHVLDSDFVGADKAARQFSSESGIHLEGGFFNWARRDGLKLAYLEAFDQMPETPDVVIQAVSSGMGIVGAWKGVQEYLRLGRISRKPRMVMVQQATCAPMVEGWLKGKVTLSQEDVVRNPQGIAKAILRNDGSASYPYLRRVAIESDGTMCMVNDDELRLARKLLIEHEGIAACYAGCAPLAAAIKLRRDGWLRGDECVLINVTGRERFEGPV